MVFLKVERVDLPSVLVEYDNGSESDLRGGFWRWSGANDQQHLDSEGCYKVCHGLGPLVFVMIVMVGRKGKFRPTGSDRPGGACRAISISN